METKKNIKTFGQHLDSRYGKIGTEKRTDFEIKAKSFAIGIKKGRSEILRPENNFIISKNQR